MTKRLLVVGAVLMLLGAACGDDDAATTTTAAPTTTVAPTTTITEAGPVLLQVSGPGGSASLTMAELMELPAVAGWAGGKSSTGTISVPVMHTGVALRDLAALVGGDGDGYAVNVVAKDGYSITFSYAQAADGEFIAYDPGSGEEVEPEGDLVAIVAYERDGAPIPEDEDGPLRLAVVSPEQDQVVDGHWNVKWVTALEVKEAGEDWVLALRGDGTEDLDRATFDSCLACHTAEWTDEDGGVWSGVPLYLIAGRIDGGDIHGDDAYDEERAEAGYLLQVIAADGLTGEIPSDAFHLNDQVLLAAVLDGEPLGPDDGPLRVVGPGLGGRRQVGQVVEIAAVFGDAGAGDDGGGEAAGTPSDAAAPEGAVLMVTGSVDTELDLDADDLTGLGALAATIEHPRDGDTTYVGIPVAAILEAAGVAGGATTLTVVASDGYAVDIPLADLAECHGCLLAFDGDVLSMALGGFPGSAWVSDVVAFEIG